MVAEINLDEKNSSVLNNHTEITLYLHTRPEVPIKAGILSVSGKPVLTARKTYCYLIRVDFTAPRDAEVICGMRGIARIAGERKRRSATISSATWCSGTVSSGGIRHADPGRP